VIRLVLASASVCCSVSMGGAVVIGDKQDDLVFSAFRSACLSARIPSEAKRQAIIDGWRPADERQHPFLVAAMNGTYDLGDSGEESISSFGEVYRKDVEGRTMFLAVSSSTGPVNLLGCFLYDLEAAVPMPPSLLREWIGEDPPEVISIPKSVEVQNWYQPVSLRGIWSVRYGFIAADSSAVAETGFSGQWLGIVSLAEGGH